MDQVLRLPLQGRHDRLGRVPDREHPDAAGQVDELIAVDVGHEAAVGRGDADRSQSALPWGSRPPAWRRLPGSSARERW